MDTFGENNHIGGRWEDLAGHPMSVIEQVLVGVVKGGQLLSSEFNFPTDIVDAELGSGEDVGLEDEEVDAGDVAHGGAQGADDVGEGHSGRQARGGHSQAGVLAGMLTQDQDHGAADDAEGED